MARKPRSPRSARSLSLGGQKTYSVASPTAPIVDNRDSVPTADLSGEDYPFLVPDEPVIQIDDEPTHDAGAVRHLFSPSSPDAAGEDDDFLLARVSKRRKSKDSAGGDEVSARRAHNKAARRRLAAVRIMIGVLVAGLCAAGVYVALFSQVFSLSLNAVKISAPEGTPIGEGDIREALRSYEGLSLVRLSADDIARRIEEEVPGTEDVKVRRVWAHGLSVSYSLVEPHACLVVGETCKPLDDNGRLIPEALAADVSSLLHIVYSGKTTDVASVMEPAQSVLNTLADDVRANTARLEIDVTGNIRLILNDGRVVIWGKATDNQTKSSVLTPLLSQPATTYDVSAPQAPVSR
ncbi:MAG: FtsQ-type POTRA domain-containing protein [Actinomycetaceae bacterium]|nr:FtsQ-type POTRA domain-containing protein [Actinomycetaceae bacterium]